MLNFILFYFIILYSFIVICDCYLELCIYPQAYKLLLSYHPARGSNSVLLKKIDLLSKFVGHLGFLVVKLAKKVCLFIFLAFICQKLFIHNGAGGHFGFTPLEKKALIFARDTGAKYFLKGSRKSNQSSKQPESGHES